MTLLRDMLEEHFQQATRWLFLLTLHQRECYARLGCHPYCKGIGQCPPWSAVGDPPGLGESSPTIDRFVEFNRRLFRGELIDPPACVLDSYPSRLGQVIKLPANIRNDPDFLSYLSREVFQCDANVEEVPEHVRAEFQEKLAPHLHYRVRPQDTRQFTFVAVPAVYADLSRPVPDDYLVTSDFTVAPRSDRGDSSPSRSRAGRGDKGKGKWKPSSRRVASNGDRLRLLAVLLVQLRELILGRGPLQDEPQGQRGQLLRQPKMLLRTLPLLLRMMSLWILRQVRTLVRA
jgi:hypothetical protein